MLHDARRILATVVQVETSVNLADLNFNRCMERVALVMEISYLGKKVFLCEVCAFGYVERSTASDCEDYCRAHKGCSLQITRKAVLRPE